MDFISVFSGIGGIDLGLERSGMHCVAQVENDQYCLDVLTKHWSDVPKFKDVRDVGKHNLPSADLICGGFPCQPHSYAGKRKGENDDRNLWGEYFRIIKECKYKYVVGENVPGIQTTILDQILFDLESIGYTVQTFIIPACAFNAKHRRDRVFILADSHSQGLEGWKETLLPAQERDPIQRHYWQDISQEWRNDQWDAEPDVCRVADGIPHRVDRLRALGNSVVPQVAEFIGHCIMEMELLYADS
jgi:DNA (cytosine-5)-methyltransferase 1